MKLAAITSSEGFFAIKRSELSYHMVLGQDLVSCADTHNFYANRHLRGDFIMVDNGAAEPSEERVPFSEIVHAADTVGADEIVMPDVLRDKQGTLELLRDIDTIRLVHPRQRCLVPQGATLSEWLQCLDYMIEYIPFATIGIPKHLEAIEGGRKCALEQIIRQGYHKHYHVHLLGVWKHPFTEIGQAIETLPTVRGIDTAAPIAYAQNRSFIRDDVHFSVDWKGSVPFSLALDNIQILLRFIDACKNHRPTK